MTGPGSSSVCWSSRDSTPRRRLPGRKICPVSTIWWIWRKKNPARLAPGSAGPPLLEPVCRIRSHKDFSNLIQSLITAYDLSPLAIHALMRSALAETVHSRDQPQTVDAEPILSAFDDLFEATRVGARVKRLRHSGARHLPKPPSVRKHLWQSLVKTPIRIPVDYIRDGVCCLFRLLDGALLSRIPAEPGLVEALDRALDGMWLPSQRPCRVDWRTLYGAEKGLNVYGWAGAVALAHLQGEVFLPALTEDLERQGLMTAEAVVPGRTDPLLLRYLAWPVIAHGRWAMQSAVTVENAHPFMDAGRRRALALNGQFDSRVEARLSTFLQTLGGYRLRSGNSAEYTALLWGHFYDQLVTEQRRGDLVRRQVRKEMAEIAICSQPIDFGVYHRVRRRPPAELDRMAFVAAARQIAQNGGQIAVTGISLVSPRRLYVASHNRPVFIVRRLKNDDFMVVSDVNAALGLFPQALIEETINELDRLQTRRNTAVAQLAAEGADPSLVRGCTEGFDKERRGILASFAVEVHPLDGEELFACIETVLEKGRVGRTVTITDFDDRPQPDVEPFQTCLDPVTVRKDVNMSFHESHLREVPERFRYILSVYGPRTDGGPSMALRARSLRRRFGRRLEGLRRLVLVGTGSTFHMALIAGRFLADLLPDLAMDVLRPGDIEDAKHRFQPQQDLVLMVSWSSTTAEMVQLAQRLLAQGVLMVGVTEKSFADMALAAGKSGGVLPVLSGEEVTIAGVKSTLCTLLCLNLLGGWFCGEKGAPERFNPVWGRLKDLAERIGQLNDDSAALAFSRQIAGAAAHAHVLVVVGGQDADGTGREAAHKLEEASWYAVGRWYSYPEVLATDPGSWPPGRFVIVHATRRAHMELAVAVMERLFEAGIDFVAVTCPNRHQARIDGLCAGRCLVLPWIDDSIQPYMDLAFYYRLALDLGEASGHGIGVGPRNRTKSSTVTRSRPEKHLSPAAELRELAAATPVWGEGAETAGPDNLLSWAAGTEDAEAAESLSELRWLARQLGREAPLAALGGEADTGELGRLLFHPRSEINDLAFVSLDPEARAVVRDVAAFWRRLVNMPIRELPLGQWPCAIRDETLWLVAATGAGGQGSETPVLPKGVRIAWLGPEPPVWLGPAMATAGAFVLPSGNGRCSPARLYLGLHLLLAKAWSHQAAEKGAVVREHIQVAANCIEAVMGHGQLLDDLRAVAADNLGYRTAFFISPFAGAGRIWEDRFDAGGRLTLVHHPPGHAGHGPIVTIDGQVEVKYPAMDSRREMVARYGEARVALWENRYLGGEGIDEFLDRPGGQPLPRPRAPFYAGNRWHLPELVPGYDTRRDNLIILDMTGQRHLPLMLDELSLLGSRFPRLVVITQQARIREMGKKTLFGFPVSALVVLPGSVNVPMADAHLPLVLGAVGTALAAVWKDAFVG